MTLMVCVLASGSKGNSTLVAGPSTRVLIDAGLSARETGKRLADLDLTIGDLDAVCLSHEHADHVAGLRVLHQRHGLACYANHGTAEALDQAGDINWRIFSTGSAFTVGELTIEPFAVPHDAYEPVGYVVSTNGSRVGIVSDMGVATTLIQTKLSGCGAVVIEANHDEDMLQASERPWSLKQRIMGRQGHLSNRAAADLAVSIAGPELEKVFLAHLSEDCNRGHLAEREVRDALQDKGWRHVDVSLTWPDRISSVWSRGA